MIIPYSKLPAGVQSPMQQYIRYGLHPGGFLYAVIVNDLRRAVEYGSAENLKTLPDIVQWLIEHAPAECHGSPGLVEMWQSKCKLRRRNAR